MVALTEPGHEGKTYELTGPEALTRREQVSRLSAAAGLDTEVAAITDEQAREAMVGAGVPEYAADGLIELNVHVYQPGYGGATAGGVREATGREPRSFDDFARDYAQAF